MNGNSALGLIGVLLVILGALAGWRAGGWLQAVIYAIGVAVVVLVVILLIHALGVAI